MNLNAAGNPGEISPRFYTVVPLALGFFYAYWRLHESSQRSHESERKFKAADFCCWLGTITFAALMRFELEADWVASAWAALAFALLVDRLAERAASLPVSGIAGGRGSSVPHRSPQFLRANLLSGAGVGEPLGHGWSGRRPALR